VGSAQPVHLTHTTEPPKRSEKGGYSRKKSRCRTVAAMVEIMAARSP
jgi:hypothetical protein